MSRRRVLKYAWSKPEQHTALIRLDGDLDYDTGDELLGALTRKLSDTTGLGELHLDCTKLDFCDSWGLSVLLMIHRRVAAMGATLHLDNRREPLERLLERTHTLIHLTGPAAVLSEQQQDT
jgi:anti-anti-sigma factor